MDIGHWLLATFAHWQHSSWPSGHGGGYLRHARTRHGASVRGYTRRRFRCRSMPLQWRHLRFTVQRRWSPKEDGRYYSTFFYDLSIPPRGAHGFQILLILSSGFTPSPPPTPMFGRFRANPAMDCCQIAVSRRVSPLPPLGETGGRRPHAVEKNLKSESPSSAGGRPLAWRYDLIVSIAFTTVMCLHSEASRGS